VFDGDPAPPQKKGTAPIQCLAHVYCGETAGWIKMPLGTEVNLGPVDVMLGGVAAPPKRGTAPQFSAHIYCGWMKMPLGTEVDLGPGYIVLTGTQLPSRKGHTSSPLFRPCLLWPRPPISATAELLFKIAAIRHLGFLETGFFNCGYTSECHYASSCKILWQSVQLFLRYGDFSISQNGGRPPSGICCEHV